MVGLISGILSEQNLSGNDPLDRELHRKSFAR